ncbi:MAG: DEAD/DEAH box helicase [Candidatus Dadabacteria bacterium]|nr:MAG: DEAD/DEAH box helicase [Candidatus Dadabacteria bacterium]
MTRRGKNQGKNPSQSEIDFSISLSMPDPGVSEQSDRTSPDSKRFFKSDESSVADLQTRTVTDILPGYPLKADNIECIPEQVKAVLRAESGKNFLFEAPTGSGKSYIAAMIAAGKIAAGKRVLYLTATETALGQFEGDLERTLAVPRQQFLAVSGKIPPTEREKLYSEGLPSLLAALPGTIQNDLEKGRIKPSDFSLIIIDEVHMLRGDHAFSKVLEYFKDHSPQIIGMTATVPVKEERRAFLLERLGVQSETALNLPVRPLIEKVIYCEPSKRQRDAGALLERAAGDLFTELLNMSVMQEIITNAEELKSKNDKARQFVEAYNKVTGAPPYGFKMPSASDYNTIHNYIWSLFQGFFPKSGVNTPAYRKHQNPYGGPLSVSAAIGVVRHLHSSLLTIGLEPTLNKITEDLIRLYTPQRVLKKRPGRYMRRAYLNPHTLEAIDTITKGTPFQRILPQVDMNVPEERSRLRTTLQVAFSEDDPQSARGQKLLKFVGELKKSIPDMIRELRQSPEPDHPALPLVTEALRDHLRTHPGSKGIIITEDTYHAKTLAEILTDELKDVGIKPVVVKSENSARAKRATQKNIEAFKKGEVNLIVGTSAIEQSFHAADTDFVVIWNPTSVWERFAQQRGRVRQRGQAESALVLTKITRGTEDEIRDRVARSKNRRKERERQIRAAKELQGDLFGDLG